MSTVRGSGTKFAGGGARCCASPLRLLVILAGLLAAAVLPAQTQSLEAALARSRYSAEQQKRIEEQFREAAALGIPVSLLLPRLEEGIAKRVPAPRMAEVLRGQVELLLQARGLLASVPGGEALQADTAAWARTANLLAGALPAAEVRLLAGFCTRRLADYRPATSLYLSLLEWGLGREQSQGLLQALLESRFSGASFPGVMEILVEGRRQRLAAEELARRLLLHIPETTTMEELKRRTLR
jgi:hypothetical protein